jgi:hypothetical protein
LCALLIAAHRVLASCQAQVLVLPDQVLLPVWVHQGLVSRQALVRRVWEQQELAALVKVLTVAAQ